MRHDLRIELVYFNGCPNAAVARTHIQEAITAVLDEETRWTEWDLMADSTPADLKRFGSPTVLVNGQDVTGHQPGNDAMACRADGAPSAEMIAARLR
jgi:hypothetical protein